MLCVLSLVHIRNVACLRLSSVGSQSYWRECMRWASTLHPRSRRPHYLCCCATRTFSHHACLNWHIDNLVVENHLKWRLVRQKVGSRVMSYHTTSLGPFRRLLCITGNVWRNMFYHICWNNECHFKRSVNRLMATLRTFNWLKLYWFDINYNYNIKTL